MIDQAEADFLASTERKSTDIAKQCSASVLRCIQQMEEYQQNQGATIGIPTGFLDLDRMTGGMQGGQMIVLAARPSMGKTSLAMNIAESVALNTKLPVGVFSLEMTEDQLVMRSICSVARVNLRNVRDGALAERDFPKLTSAAGRISAAPIYIDDTGGLSIMQLRARARRMVQMYGIKLFVVDYIQLLNSTNKRAQNRQQEIGDISRGLKSLSKDLGVPVVVLAQLNRELEKDKNRKPRLSDLRESGDIEQDADVVGLLYKPATENEDAPESAAVPVNLLVAKQRNGPTGDVELMFLKEYTRFESVARVADEPDQNYTEQQATQAELMGEPPND
jgi:replicative DNA helicase